jgi:hypothetical protein
MPLIPPAASVQLRRHWQVAVAALALAGFLVVHVVVFQPTMSRYRTALKAASDLGLSLDPEQPAQMIPPRVLALLTENSLPVSAAASQRESGLLTAALLDDLTQLTNRHGLVILSAEPGAVSDESKAVQVRARLKLQGSFARFTAFLDDLGRSQRLTAVDRFTMAGGPPATVDLWVTRYVLKQTRRGAR